MTKVHDTALPCSRYCFFTTLPSPTSLILVEGNRLLREGLAAMVHHQEDLQIVAANAGGALVIARRPAAAASLKVLRSSLETARARVVATLFSDA